MGWGRNMWVGGGHMGGGGGGGAVTCGGRGVTWGGWR